MIKTSYRRHSREMALQVLYQMEYDSVFDVNESLNIFVDCFDPSFREFKYAKYLVFGVIRRIRMIDGLLSSVSRRWKVERMAKVDRNILRIATFELLFTKEVLPPKVVINEAIEVAKNFGDRSSFSFINAVLDNLLFFRK